ncbi:MAG: hypothetical protein LBS88_01620 [Tannerellaceae bacterium]|nr:hypothetical protein [Tannerellaceae bacterium]
MRPNLLFILIFLHLLPGLYAADNLRIGSMRSIGMGGNEATSSALFNPSLIALAGHYTVGINYFNRYALKELGTINGSLYLPNDMLPLGVDVASFGYDAYRESMFRFLMAKRLNPRWILGISIQYALLQTELFEEQPAQLSADLGLTYAPLDNLLTSLLIINFPSASFGNESTEKKVLMYYLIQAGFQWQVFNHTFISATLETGETHAIGGSLGLEYIAFDDFSIRAGVKGAPLLPSFGFGYRFSAFSIDVAAVYHLLLGVSTGVSVSFSF